ncbi:NUDIX hydrolase [Crassaminicella profunda]|uniref:NUDIX hydrolase n=1 Tax=Crassaminicella profunda TaxID=1286698 RepID=UPI001CA77A07|nr:NUDIX hydrolase [Crassaminicella profunda]QZY56822.1 NUDIX hydrolase [Crassaminicella profunda]
MIPNEITIKSNKIFDGKMINLRVDTVLLPGEKKATREIVEHPGAVAIVPITEDNKIVMVKQFRKPVDSILLEIPAGKIDKNEKPLTCAIRELKEETGYEAKDIKFLFSFYTSAGFSNEVIHLYLAKDLISGEACPDEDEYIELEYIGINELVEMIYDGKIKDSKTIMAILAVKDLLV